MATDAPVMPSGCNKRLKLNGVYGSATDPTTVTAPPPGAIVWKWNCWDPLEEVIVGNAYNSHVPDFEPAWEARIGTMHQFATNVGYRGDGKVERAQAQMDGFANLLASRGVIVHRPDKMENKTTIAPDWVSVNMGSWMCPRDTLLALGNEIVEAPMNFRNRFWENQAYRSLITKWYKEDPNFMWSAGPPPRNCEESYHKHYGRQPPNDYNGEPGLFNEEEIIKKKVENRLYIGKPWFEPTFDAADCICLGKDIFCEHSHTANEFGHEWLRRKCSSKGMRLHSFHIPQHLKASHIDAAVMPCRGPDFEKGTPGKIILGPGPAACKEMTTLLEANNWDIIRLPPSPTHLPWPKLCKGASPDAYALNCFVIDPHTVVMEENEHDAHKMMESHGFEVLKLPFRDAYEFGGSFHCATLDVRRRGGLKSFFPSEDKQSEGTDEKC